MKASKFTDVQKAFVIKQGEEGTPVALVWGMALRTRLGIGSLSC